MSEIVIGTSLAPYDFERQSRAVYSWIQNGFRVVSCNLQEEINLLKSHFEDVEFVEVKRCALKESGKPLPYMQDIICNVSQRAEKVCGFINSDIIVDRLPKDMLYFLEKEAVGSFLFAHRYDIDDISDVYNLNWRIHFAGIDMFLMDKSLTEDFFQDGFFVQSTWDLCILLKCKMKGILIKEIVNPILFHKKHSIKWNFDMVKLLSENFYSKYYGTTEGAYEKLQNEYYNGLFQDCQQIAYCENEKQKFLFILDGITDETVESIRAQDYSGQIDIKVRSGITEDSDYIVSVKGTVILNRVFCKAVIYITSHFNCKEIVMNSFFVSKLGEEWRYNELNRNTNLLEKIGREVGNRTKVISRNGSEKAKELSLPLLYEKIDIYRSYFINRFVIKNEIYLMPAGVRASKWYELYHNKLNIVGFLDNSIKKVGTRLYGKGIFSTAHVRNKNITVIVCSNYYTEEIIIQMEKLVGKNGVIDAGHILEVSDKGEIFYFDNEKYSRYRKAF